MKISIFLFFSLLLTCIIATEQILPPQEISLENTITSRQTVKGDGYGGEGYTVLPVLRNEKPPCTAILIHGLGGSGEEWGFISLALSFFSLNYVKFIIPSAERRDVTYLNERLPSWFNIFRRSGLTTTLNKEELLNSADRMNKIIKGEIDAGVPSERIFVIGFSQGGAVALTTFLRSERTLAGVIGVATWLPLDNEYPGALSDKIRKRDTLLIHVSTMRHSSETHISLTKTLIPSTNCLLILTLDVPSFCFFLNRERKIPP